MSMDPVMAWGVPLGVLALAWAWLGVMNVRMWRAMPPLARVPPQPPPGTAWPSLAVIVPSRNEARAVEAATRSLLAQDYPVLTVIAVDDRSDDGTGAILDGLAPGDSRLRVEHVTQLPDGWLGKNHANHVGAQHAAADWLLFTDGDVLFAPGTLRTAMAFALRAGLGHLVTMPTLIAPGFWERSAQTAVMGTIAARYRAWQLTHPRTQGFVGVGAFNLVRRDAYERVGGHRKLALEVADDMKLGMMLRRSGVVQGIGDSQGLIRVRWQEGLLGSYRGLLKNAFSSLNFRWSLVALLLPVMLAGALLPAAALLFAPTGLLRALGAFNLLLPAVIHSYYAVRCAGGSGWEGITQPLHAFGMIGMVLTSAALTLLRGGVVWRGTHYPIGRLRAGGVHEEDWPLDAVVGWDPDKAR